MRTVFDAGSIGWRCTACLIWLVGWSSIVEAGDLLVDSRAEIVAALAAAQPGDRILIEPGTYSGGFLQSGLTGVTIRSADPANPAIIQGGGGSGIQLGDATDVVIEHLIFQGASGNGINIDDGGSFSTPSTNITIRDVVVRDVGGDINRDGIKLSGVTGFTIDRVQIIDWGASGSAVDPTGSHNGLIQNSLFRQTKDGTGGTVVRPKGGSKNITIRANRFELPTGTRRAIQAGGGVPNPDLFRFIDGDCCYAADEIVAEGNVILGASSAFSYANIDGGIFHHNYAERPNDWVIRILNEQQSGNYVETQNGQFLNNKIVFNDTATEFRRAVNIGPMTLPQTFVFEGNQWFNQADPTRGGSFPILPAPETNGIYGVDPEIDPDRPIAWDFDWGRWIVNASELDGIFTPDDPTQFRIATPGPGATFLPLEANPLQGNWTLSSIIGPDLSVDSFSQIVLLAIPEPSSLCLVISLGMVVCLRRRPHGRNPG